MRALISGASVGITIVAGIPRRFAAMATAIAWLPEEKATTPRRRSSAESCESVLKAPRNLNAPPSWRFSHLKKTCAWQRSSSSALRSTGVRTACPSRRSAAAATSSNSMASASRADVVFLYCVMSSFPVWWPPVPRGGIAGSRGPGCARRLYHVRPGPFRACGAIMQASIHRNLAQPRIYQAMPLADAIRREIETCGARRVFVTTTRSLGEGRIVAGAVEALGDRFVGKFDALPAHSPRESVIEGARRVREAGADRILAIGGGSVIDSTKVMLQAIWYGIDDVDALAAIAGGRHAGGRYPDDWQRDPQSLRMIAVSTTLSAAEFSHRAGVTDTSTGRKLGFVHPLVAPEAVILDPAATLDTPMDLLLSTGVRSIDHAVERWCAARTVPYSDAMAHQAMVMLLDALPRMHADPADLEAHHDAQLGMWLSMLPGATDVPMGASHGIGYILGGAYGVPHGITS